MEESNLPKPARLKITLSLYPDVARESTQRAKIMDEKKAGPCRDGYLKHDGEKEEKLYLFVGETICGRSRSRRARQSLHFTSMVGGLTRRLFPPALFWLRGRPPFLVSH